MAPKAEKQPAKKVAKSVDGSKKKGRKNKAVETYKIYIYKVLKQVKAGLLHCSMSPRKLSLQES